MSWKILLHTEAGQISLLIISLLIVRLIIKKYLALFIIRTVRSHKYDDSESEIRRERTLINISITTLSTLIWVIGVIGLLAILHVNIAGLITGAGVIGIIVGLGGQSAIKDYLAGFFILMENQYRVGDIIKLGEVSGSVERISLRITQLRDLDGNLHIVPNGSINTVTNHSFGWSNVNMNIAVSYDVDIDKVKKVINETGRILADDQSWNLVILEPIKFLRLDGFGDSAVTVKALGKVSPGKQWDVAGEFRIRLKLAFEKNGIEVPYPQRVVHSVSKKPILK